MDGSHLLPGSDHTWARQGSSTHLDPRGFCILLMAPALCHHPTPLLGIFGMVQVHLCNALSPSCNHWSLSPAVVPLEGNSRAGKLKFLQNLQNRSRITEIKAPWQPTR